MPKESISPHYDCHPAMGQQEQPIKLSPAQMALIQTYVAPWRNWRASQNKTANPYVIEIAI
jgi:hypothetical protein